MHGGHVGFRIGRISVGFSGGCKTDIAMVPPLSLFRSEHAPLDIEIQVERVSNMQAAGTPIFDSGSTWRLYQGDREFQFDFSAPFFGDEPYKRLVVDDRFTRGVLQMNGKYSARTSFPGAALSYPLDELLITHRLTQEKAIELHGSGIVRPDGTGNLFVGHSGAGKSTTTRLWTEREDVHVLSDDRIIVRRDEPAVETPRHANGATNKQQVLRLRDRSASPNGHFAQDDKVKKQHSAQDYTAKTTRFAQADKPNKTWGCGCMGRLGMGRRCLLRRGARLCPEYLFLSMDTAMC